MTTWLTARKSWSFFLILWVVLLAGAVAIDAMFSLALGSTHLGFRSDLRESFGWAAGLTLVRWLSIRYASKPRG